jgi:hypothetical protein
LLAVPFYPVLTGSKTFTSDVQVQPLQQDFAILGCQRTSELSSYLTFSSKSRVSQRTIGGGGRKTSIDGKFLY